MSFVKKLRNEEEDGDNKEQKISLDYKVILKAFVYIFMGALLGTILLPLHSLLHEFCASYVGSFLVILANLYLFLPDEYIVNTLLYSIVITIIFQIVMLSINVGINKLMSTDSISKYIQ
eukprot:Pgem_evm1s14429